MSHFPTFFHTAGRTPWLYVTPASVPASDPRRHHHTTQGGVWCVRVTPALRQSWSRLQHIVKEHIRYQAAAIQPPSLSPCSSIQSHLYAQTLHLEEVGGLCDACKEVFCSLHRAKIMGWYDCTCSPGPDQAQRENRLWLHSVWAARAQTDLHTHTHRVLADYIPSAWKRSIYTAFIQHLETPSIIRPL